VPLFGSRTVRLRRYGRYDMRLPDDHRELIAGLAAELAELVATDDPGLERLFPSPYPDDAERDAGWHALVRHELVERHLESIAVVRETAHAEVVDDEQLARWMTAVNALRLVLGTRLQVGEDDEPVRPSDPRYGAFALYEVLGWLLEEIVRGRSEAL